MGLNPSTLASAGSKPPKLRGRRFVVENDIPVEIVEFHGELGE